MNKLLALPGLFALAASSSATVTLFDATWSGAPEGNNASAVITVGMDLSKIDFHALNVGVIGSTTAFSSLSVTVAGSTHAVDNGTFAEADYFRIYLQMFGPVDVTQDWVPQSGFNAFDVEAHAGSTAPTFGTLHTLVLGNGHDETLDLVSFTPRAVPEPTSLAILGLGAAVVVRRRRG